MTPTRTRKTATTPAAKTPPAISLDDLSPADRARLLDEARSAPAVELDEAAARRQEQIAALLSDRDHARNCPGGRIEAFNATRPADPDRGLPRRDVTIIRCIECAGSATVEQPYAELLAGLDETA